MKVQTLRTLRERVDEELDLASQIQAGEVGAAKDRAAKMALRDTSALGKALDGIFGGEVLTTILSCALDPMDTLRQLTDLLTDPGKYSVDILTDSVAGSPMIRVTADTTTDWFTVDVTSTGIGGARVTEQLRTKLGKLPYASQLNLD